jgi:hypothetical protein
MPMALGEQIRFVCASPEHRRTGRDPEGGELTVNAGEWAFCPWGGSEDHTWSRVEGMDLSTARKRPLPQEVTAGQD